MTRTPPLLPDFIVIGAMKSGTTTLYRHLADHPGISMSRDKETDFFVAEKNWHRGFDWYAAQFDARHQGKRGEASPNYTKCRDFPGVAARIARHCPAVRLIYIVRDPVLRAESQFRHAVLTGALRPDLADFAESPAYAHLIDASLYARQLDFYLAHFPRDAILVLDFDDLLRDAQAVMDLVAPHLGVAAHPVTRRVAQNDSRELARVPAPILRFAQSGAGRSLTGLVSRDGRDRLRAALALARPRQAPEFPPALIDRLQQDLAADAARFRAVTGMAFAQWSV
jgi:hypothetical protein